MKGNLMVTNLSELKRFLATDGAQVRLIKFQRVDGGEFEIPIDPRIAGWRLVVKVQTNSVAFETASGRSWLDFGKASEWKFSDGVAIKNDGHTILSYELGNA
jgi:hypothetical protein